MGVMYGGDDVSWGYCMVGMMYGGDDVLGGRCIVGIMKECIKEI